MDRSDAPTDTETAEKKRKRSKTKRYDNREEDMEEELDDNTLDSDTDQEDEHDVDMGEVEVPAGPLYTPGMFGKFAFAFSTYILFLLELGCHYYNSLPI